MRLHQLGIEGAWEVTPEQHRDSRGLFLEWYRFDRLAEKVGHPLRLAQASMSVSRRGVVRGIHFADVPPGQAKYVTCVHGAVLDVVADLRVGSPTYGRWESVRLDDANRKALYISEGMGHGVCALTDRATLSYLCSQTYNPTGERSIHPLDPELAVHWPGGELHFSPRDQAAPLLGEARSGGLLPDYAACRAFTKSLSTGSA
ncbi:dTDP-4-dehydrorhamnose 3,5-epimerase family protein [Streptantibioticus ferralitis]|uniref:dTDP-4-dehydrorhamnose 3,5-epimerase n=1 Tax=Streptantibioticus ferralitis TaxID=236510 RepID=A0ABT5Z0S7_9ACTN|nr:dTDP-4-dehydrorhamnose 3,5-epimerase [Streptantibioticus ferralitis]MDF2257437.1 dTDP-4-dehydrorhamnose 3,5-epimerase [Streptantibioticus ferralitis]